MELAEVVDRIVREHATTPARDDDFTEAGAEVAALFRRIATASLFDGALVLARDPMEDIASVRGLAVYRIGRLHDGRSLCAAVTGGEATYFVGPLVRTQEYPSNAIGVVRYVADTARCTVLAGSLAQILDGALASRGELDHLASGSL